MQNQPIIAGRRTDPPIDAAPVPARPTLPRIRRRL